MASHEEKCPRTHLWHCAGQQNLDWFKIAFSCHQAVSLCQGLIYEQFINLQICIIAIITTTLFIRTRMHHETVEDGNMYLGALFFSLVSFLFNGIPEMAMTIERLPVFYKQRDMLFFPPWAYALPTWILTIPVSLLQSFVWVIITYYGIGYSPEAER